MAPSLVKFDDVEFDDYIVAPDLEDPNSLDYAAVLIPSIDFSKVKTHTFEIDLPAADNANLHLETIPTFLGQDSTETDLPETYQGNPLYINFTDNKISAVAHDIDYGSVKYSDVGRPLTGVVESTTDNPDQDLLTVSDNRRNRTAVQVYLTQTTGFTDGEHALSSELRFYQSSVNFEKLTAGSILLSKTTNGMAIPSVSNNEVQGLKLYIYNSVLKTGQYKSKLDWSIVSAPE
ncbi:hypothetical protein [Lapidilactobacillus wuchangensis]|uniref:hypothetical protein n=1 Tax=Lapidilactobacillus wuchangensis TaxID=2486001 RepID=UPI0013DE3DE4|nr:hypothetical protein [Lapidilactobacillus wuchangensis]